MVLFNFNLKKNPNIFKDFYSDLVRKLVRKLPIALSKFSNNLAKQCYKNIEKSCHNSNYPVQHWKLFERFWLAWTHQQLLAWTEYPQNL